LKDLQKELDKRKGPKDRKPWQDKIEDLTDDIKGHEKEIKQKWPWCPI
jgi:hypothetical protein